MFKTDMRVSHAEVWPEWTQRETATTSSSAAPSGKVLAHIFCVSGLATTVMMLATATEMGPFAPLLIALALYLGVFCSVVEATLWLWWAAGVVRRWRAGRSVCIGRPALVQIHVQGVRP